MSYTIELDDINTLKDMLVLLEAMEQSPDGPGVYDETGEMRYLNGGDLHWYRKHLLGRCHVGWLAIRMDEGKPVVTGTLISMRGAKSHVNARMGPRHGH